MVPTFLIGTAFLLVWFLVTSADGTAMRLFWKGVLYFVFAPLLLVPLGLLVGGLGLGRHSDWVLFAIIVITPVIEETFKLWASRSEDRGSHVFAIVALFGVIELMLSKPFMMAGAPDNFTALLNSFQAVPALFMHLLTAAIYGFCWRDRRDRQFIVCVCIHGLWNALATNSFTPPWVLHSAIPLFVLAIFYLGPRSRVAWRRDWNALPAD